MGSKKIVTKIKDALSRGSRSPSPEPGPSMGESSDSPFTQFVLSNLDEQDQKMVATTFAPQIQTDCDARNLDFDDFFHLLGHTSKRDAVRTLKRTISEGEIVLGTSAKNSTGRPRDIYLVSVNQFEEVLLAANTDAGKKWRKLVLKIKNLVVQFMKMEMEEQVAQLAIKDDKLEELEAVQTRLHATLETERARQAKKEMRKAQQKTPLEKNYLLSNSPGGTGPYKLGKTNADGKKRAKEMQTGNHENLTCVFEIACTDSYLIERVAQHVFYDYRINDKLEWFDAPKDSMASVLTFLVETIDGLRRVDHDEYQVKNPLRTMIEGVRALEGHRREDDDFDYDDILAGPVVLNRIEEWLVKALENDSLPARIYKVDLPSEIKKIFPQRPLIDQEDAKQMMMLVSGVVYTRFRLRKDDMVAPHSLLSEASRKDSNKWGYKLNRELIVDSLVAQRKMRPLAIDEE